MTEATEGREIRVVHNAARSRYEVFVGEDLAGHADYRPGDDHDDRYVVTHTEIGAQYEGQGLAGRLAHDALDDVAGRGGSVVAQCSFIAAYIRRHPEYATLVGTATDGSWPPSSGGLTVRPDARSRRLSSADDPASEPSVERGGVDARVGRTDPTE
jgi:predicted GNAT family acetyltransferase